MSGVIRPSSLTKNELLFLPQPRTSHTKDSQSNLCTDVLSGCCVQLGHSALHPVKGQYHSLTARLGPEISSRARLLLLVSPHKRRKNKRAKHTCLYSNIYPTRCNVTQFILSGNRCHMFWVGTLPR